MAIDAMMDASVQYLKDNVTQLCVCSAEPASYAEATTTYDTTAGKYNLAKKAHTISGALANGDVSGRKVPVGACSEMDIVITDGPADATHVALTSATTLLYVTTCVSQQLTHGNKVTVPTWDVEVRDPL